MTTLLTAVITAQADSDPELVHGYYVSPISMGSHFIYARGPGLVVVAMDGSNPVYWIELGQELSNLFT